MDVTWLDTFPCWQATFFVTAECLLFVLPLSEDLGLVLALLSSMLESECLEVLTTQALTEYAPEGV